MVLRVDAVRLRRRVSESCCQAADATTYEGTYVVYAQAGTAAEGITGVAPSVSKGCCRVKIVSSEPWHRNWILAACLLEVWNASSDISPRSAMRASRGQRPEILPSYSVVRYFSRHGRAFYDRICECYNNDRLRRLQYTELQTGPPPRSDRSTVLYCSAVRARHHALRRRARARRPYPC